MGNDCSTCSDDPKYKGKTLSKGEYEKMQGQKYKSTTFKSFSKNQNNKNYGNIELPKENFAKKTTENNYYLILGEKAYRIEDIKNPKKHNLEIGKIKLKEVLKTELKHHSSKIPNYKIKTQKKKKFEKTDPIKIPEFIDMANKRNFEKDDISYFFKNLEIYNKSEKTRNYSNNGNFEKHRSTLENENLDKNYLLNGKKLKGFESGVFFEGVFEGNFKNGKREGFGKLKTSEFVYSGQFFDGCFEGNGIKDYNDGSRYQGDFKNGKENGLGRFTDSEGIVVRKGKWKNGIFLG